MIIGTYNKNTDRYDREVPLETLYSQYGIFHGRYSWEIKCDICGKIFTADRPKKYCCKECSSKANIEQRKHRKLVYRNKVCEFCHNSFNPKRNDAKFCSNACRMAAHRSVKPIENDNKVFFMLEEYSIDKLKNNNIKVVVDTRVMTENRSGLPVFVSKEKESAVLAQNNIEYIYNTDLNERAVKGKNKNISSDFTARIMTADECKEYYESHLMQIDIQLLLKTVKRYGKAVFLCSDKYSVDYAKVLSAFIKECGQYEEVINL